MGGENFVALAVHGDEGGVEGTAAQVVDEDARRRELRVLAWRCVYSKPAAEGSLSIAVTAYPALRKASRVRKRCAEWAWAGTPTTASSASPLPGREASTDLPT